MVITSNYRGHCQTNMYNTFLPQIKGIHGDIPIKRKEGSVPVINLLLLAIVIIATCSLTRFSGQLIDCRLKSFNEMLASCRNRSHSSDGVTGMVP